jgi:hypothetical protein
MKALCIACLTAVSVCSNVSGEQFRTDINPALLYYQAFLLAPNFEGAERDFLYDAHGWKLPERFGELVDRYDPQLRLVRRAAHATVPCDWGIDTSDGPATMLPHLARAKAVVQGARLRAMWELQQGRPADARDDLVAALTLGRNLSHNGTFIAALVQAAIEAIICSSIAENFGQYPPEALQKLLEGINAAPARGTMAAWMPSEKAFFQDRAVNEILELQRENPSSDAKVMEGIREFMMPDIRRVEGVAMPEQRARWEHLTRAAGGTSDGILKLLRERGQFYDQMESLMALPYSEYRTRIRGFTKEFENAENPLVSESAGALLRGRTREFRILATLEMVRAAIEYKLQGEAGLQKVVDSCGNGPFAFRRFVFEGVDRGFELRSAYDLEGAPAVLIFVEKDGPPFRLSGPQAGKAFDKESAEDAFRKRYGLDRGPAPAK